MVELVKELSKLYDERRMAQSGLPKDNPMLERIDLKIRVLRDNLLENLKNPSPRRPSKKRSCSCACVMQRGL